MTAEEFQLQPSIPPRAGDFDIDPITEDWPMPPVRPWEPAEHFPWWIGLLVFLGVGSALRKVRRFRALLEGYPERRRAEAFQRALERDAAERRARIAAAFRAARERLLP